MDIKKIAEKVQKSWRHKLRQIVNIGGINVSIQVLNNDFNMITGNGIVSSTNSENLTVFAFSVYLFAES